MEEDKWTFYPYLEINHLKHWQINPGVRLRYLKGVPAFFPIGVDFQLGTDLNLKQNNNFNIRSEITLHWILALGITSQYWNTTAGDLYTLGPKFGLNFYAFEINYSRNYSLKDPSFSFGKNRVGIKIDIESIYKIIKISREE